MPRRELTDEEKAAKKAARHKATARDRERRREAAQAAGAAKHAARFNKRSTKNSVRRSLSKKALTLEEYKVAEARGLERSDVTQRKPDRWEVSFRGRITDAGLEFEHGTHRVGPRHGVSLPAGGEGPPPDENYPEPHTAPPRSVDDDDDESPYHDSQIGELAPDPTDDPWEPDYGDEYDALWYTQTGYDDDDDDRPEWERAIDL
jgi:hypothetical protein